MSKIFQIINPFKATQHFFICNSEENSLKIENDKKYYKKDHILETNNIQELDDFMVKVKSSVDWMSGVGAYLLILDVEVFDNKQNLYLFDFSEKFNYNIFVKSDNKDKLFKLIIYLKNIEFFDF